MKRAWLVALVAAAEPSNRVHTCLDLDKERKARLPKKSRQLERQWRQHDCESVPPAPPNIRRAGHSFLDAEMRRCDDLQTALIRHDRYRQELDKEGQFIQEVVDWRRAPCGVWMTRRPRIPGGEALRRACGVVAGRGAGQRPHEERGQVRQRPAVGGGGEDGSAPAPRPRPRSPADAVADIQADSKRHDRGRRVGGSMGEIAREEAVQEARGVPAATLKIS